MTHTRPSSTAEATSWRAVGAEALGCQATDGGAGTVGVDAGGAAVGEVVGGAVLVPSRHAVARRRSRATEARQSEDIDRQRRWSCRRQGARCFEVACGPLIAGPG